MQIAIYFDICGRLCVTSLLLCIFSPNPWVLSQVWGSAAECHLQLLERQVYSVARICSDQSFLSLHHRRHDAGLCMLYKFNLNWNHCLFSEVPSASTRVQHTRVAAAAHLLEREVWRCITSQFARLLQTQCKLRHSTPWYFKLQWMSCGRRPRFECGMMLDGLKGAVNRWLLPWVVFSSVFRGAGACGVAKPISKQFCFYDLGLCYWFW